jgi:hypothetical protein
LRWSLLQMRGARDTFSTIDDYSADVALMAARITSIRFVCHALADELTIGSDTVGQKALACLISSDTCYSWRRSSCL